MERHIGHMMPPLGEQSWEPDGGAAAVLEYFQAMRDVHASQLREPIAFTPEELAVLAAVAPLAPAAFATILATNHPGLRGRLCGISPTGRVEPDRKEQLAATSSAHFRGTPTTHGCANRRHTCSSTPRSTATPSSLS